ncbi:MAG: glycosyl hydrolase family 57 [Vulcanococcus sp.]
MTDTSAAVISGREAEIQAAMAEGGRYWLEHSPLKLDQLRSAFACALHMHQPTIPAGPGGELISHLQYMFEHQGEGDNHNAEPFAQCYRRLSDLIPQLIEQGCSPRIMLDVSGNLLWGAEQMGRSDITEAWRHLARDPQMQQHVEWLGTFWSHAVAPSTPIPDLRLQIEAWQHQFADAFGIEALQRVRGFSLPEMALPNHPETLFALIDALQQAGYRWVLLQEHSVETLSGEPLSEAQKYLPNRLIARNGQGETRAITALIKTQGSDTKLVGQMQPYYEAISRDRLPLGDITLPSLVSQIADGENGGVMMNEFPQAFIQAHQRCAGDHGTAAINGSEFLELLETQGISAEQFPALQAVGQHRLSAQLGERWSTEQLEQAIAALKVSDPGFSIDGASWTNDLSWVNGYESVLEPMQELSAAFHQRYPTAPTSDPNYQEALLHLLLLETSCFRYWGQGTWTDYAREIHRRGMGWLA